MLADDDVDMMYSVVMSVMLKLGGYYRIVHVADSEEFLSRTKITKLQVQPQTPSRPTYL